MAKYKLGEICEIVSGSTPKTGIAEYWDGNLKWITPAEIDDESYIITDSARKLTELGVKKTGLSSFPSGTVILSSRAPIGKVAIAGCEMYCNQGFKNLICSDRINNRYLYWFLKGNTAYLNSLGRGATFKEISKKIVSDIEINVPEISQQLAAVDALERVSEIIRLRKNQLQKLDELIKARFVELFGDPISNPMNWNKRTLKEVCTKLNDGTHFSPESFSMGDYKYITAKNIKASGFDFSNITYVPEAVHRPIFERCNPEQGDVLYIKDGATTGIAIVNTLKEEFTLLSSVALLKQNRNVINGYFLAALLNNADMYSDIRNNMGGAAITRLTIAKLNAVKVIVPPLDLQNRFAAFVHQVDKSKLQVPSGNALCIRYPIFYRNNIFERSIKC